MKLNKLLPIVALTGAATAVAPIAACSCGKIDANNKWTEFEYSTSILSLPGFKSKTKLDIKQGKKYVATLKLENDQGIPVGGDSLLVVISNETGSDYYKFVSKEDCILKIDNQTMETKLQGDSGIETEWKDEYAGKDLYFEFDCKSDYDNAIAYVLFPS